MKYPFLILREVKIEDDPLSLVSVPDDRNYYLYDDFEYQPEEDGITDDGKKLVDGYEVNFFESPPPVGELPPIKSFKVKKQFLPKSLMGNLNPGDIGIMDNNFYDKKTNYQFITNNETHKEYYQSILEYYQSVVEMNNYFRLKKNEVEKIISLLISTNRNKKIEIINK